VEFIKTVILLPDTKLPKDIPQELIGGDFTCDFTQVVQGLSDIDGDQVGGHLVV